MFIAKPSITHFVEMRVMNGGLSEVGFVDPHDPTSAVPAISYCSHFICCNHSFVTLLQSSMHHSPQILFLSELSLIQIVPRSCPPFS